MGTEGRPCPLDAAGQLHIQQQAAAFETTAQGDAFIPAN